MTISWTSLWANTENGVYDYKADWTHIWPYQFTHYFRQKQNFHSNFVKAQALSNSSSIPQCLTLCLAHRKCSKMIDPQLSESISHRHGKVKTSKVSHQVTCSSQFVVLMPARAGVKEQKEKKTQKRRFKMKHIFYFPLRESTTHLVTFVVLDPLQTPPSSPPVWK